MATNEFVAGEPILMRLAFTDEILGVPADPTTITLVIWRGIDTPLEVHLSDLTRTGTGAYYYVFDTTGAIPGGYECQVQSFGALVSMSFPQIFTIVAPSTVVLT